MDAVTQRTIAGLRLLAHIVAMPVVFVALVSLADQLVGLFPDVAGESLTF